jgi:hypothetical protein
VREDIKGRRRKSERVYGEGRRKPRWRPAVDHPWRRFIINPSRYVTFESRNKV